MLCSIMKRKSSTKIRSPPGASENRLYTDMYWDLKDVSSSKAVDNAVRKGLRQIQDNPGGIILDFGKNNINLPEVKNLIEGRLRRGFPSAVDFILISRDTLVSVFRYKK